MWAIIASAVEAKGSEAPREKRPTKTAAEAKALSGRDNQDVRTGPRTRTCRALALSVAPYLPVLARVATAV